MYSNTHNDDLVWLQYLLDNNLQQYHSQEQFCSLKNSVMYNITS